MAAPTGSRALVVCAEDSAASSAAAAWALANVYRPGDRVHLAYVVKCLMPNMEVFHGTVGTSYSFRYVCVCVGGGGCGGAGGERGGWVGSGVGGWEGGCGCEEGERRNGGRVRATRRPHPPTPLSVSRSPPGVHREQQLIDDAKARLEAR